MTDSIDQVAVQSLSAAEQIAAQNIVEATAGEVIASMLKFRESFKEYYRLYQAKSAFKGKLKSNDFNLYTTYNRDDFVEARRRAYVDFIDFQNKYNSYYGQVVKLVYVSRSEDNNFAMTVFDNNLEHVGQRTAKYYFGAVKQVFEYDKQTEYDSTWLNLVAQEVNRRWSIALEKHPGRYAWLPLLWKIDRWDGVKVNNRGTIAEAWATMYIHQFEFQNQGDLEASVEEFAVSGMGSVDNALGFFKGDTCGLTYDNVQYAIKSEEASLGGMTQVGHWVDELLGCVNAEMTFENMLEILRDKVSKEGVANQVQSLARSVVRREVKKMGDSIEENLPKTITVAIT